MTPPNRRYALDARAATPHFPGIGRTVSNLARALVPQLNADEQLFLLVDGRQPAPWPLPPADGQQVRHINAPWTPFSLAQQWRIPRLLRQHQATLYHSPFYAMPYLVTLPTLLTCYDMIPLRFPETTPPRARRFYRLLHTLAFRQAREIIAISESTRQDVVDLFNTAPEQLHVIPLAADDRFQPPPPAAIDQLRRQLELPNPFVLYLGINKPHKNLARLLEGWAQVRSPAVLAIAGAWDPRYGDVPLEIQRQGLQERVRLLGPIDDDLLPALYGAAELFVFPSLYEGFGLPVVEAMACGTPVACSYAASLPEVGGLAAAYFNPLDPADIATTLQQLLDSPQRRAAAAAAGLAQAGRFSWAKTAALTLALYRKLSL